MAGHDVVRCGAVQVAGCGRILHPISCVSPAYAPQHLPLHARGLCWDGRIVRIFCSTAVLHAQRVCLLSPPPPPSSRSLIAPSSKTARGLASSFGPVDGVVNRSGRAGSVNGIGSGSFNASGGIGGSGSGGGIGVGASVLGSHLRTYGWVKDEEVSECMNACGTEFSALERRHHCRCGRRSRGGVICHK